ncbi:MAG: Polyphosphate kinase [Candidatus Ozemobacter sibiricus]|jgi:polyphosphate kinase|uniref:Polyphosphate kinase n=1 Tax=Candidatus Ozemobacter sibiricus TaxID=2268124 RepID=A0A367ZKP5_9BACT|nr:MAG: Polyphosphate kinase [Candidatus Ozemobacter sibiricus]
MTKNRNHAKKKRANQPDRLDSRPEAAAKSREPGKKENGGRLIRLSPENYLNRELSWLEFNRRVLAQAEDPRTPLLERLNFLAIFTSNLDEFVMKRVGLLKRHVDVGLPFRRPDRMTVRQQLTAIRERILELIQRQASIYTKSVLPDLADHGIYILKYKDLKDDERQKAKTFFRERVFPVLTPLSVDPGHPFPFLSNLSTSLGIILRNPQTDEKVFARVKVPRVLPAFYSFERKKGDGATCFVSLLELIKAHLDDLFPGMKVLNVSPFRITRNAETEPEEEEAEDLRDLIEETLRQRKFERVIRLEYGPDTDPAMLQFLMTELELEEEDLYEMPALLDYTVLRAVAALPEPDLKFDPWVPQIPRTLVGEDADIFSLIRKRDILVHHPYESFSASIERFVQAAALDPHVLAIKITLYRTSADSPFISNLIKAAEAGKQVVALVELKARFDEERNIQIAQTLEKVGVHVVYGILGLKTHTKTALVVRQEPEGLRCYAHIGTGNYQPETAKIYTDLSLLTCRPDLTQDLVNLFHYLTGCSLKQEYGKLLVAPFNMQERFLELIRREIEHQRAGKPARIIAKMNSLDDQKIIQALYQASMEGVPIDLIVRGLCCLRPGLKGVSENIRVSSIIGRFLEHSRIFHFAAGSDNPLDGEFFIGSADWQSRNLLKRVEVVTPIEDRLARARIWEVLRIMREDTRLAWDMRPDGTYVQRQPKPSDPLEAALGTHQVLMDLTRDRPLSPPALMKIKGSGKKRKKKG